MESKIDLIGKKFGDWTVEDSSISELRGTKVQRLWPCVCSCGTKRLVLDLTLRNGGSRSCGCSSVKRLSKHGLTNSLEHKSWIQMRRRCLQPNDQAWDNYGGRGIRICERWNQFEYFLLDIGPRLSAQYSIERVNVNGNYEPGNCFWATKKEQANNKRSNHIIEFNGLSMTMSQWGEKTGIGFYGIKNRLKLGWTIERTLTEPINFTRRITKEYVA